MQYNVTRYDVNTIKDILGLWVGEAEGKHYWMQVLDDGFTKILDHLRTE